MRTPLTFAALTLAAACGGRSAAADSTAAAAGAQATADTALAASAAGPGAGSAATATAAMRDSAGRDLGTVTLTDGASGVTVSGTLRGLPPGEHAIHVHTAGRCEPPFTTAGDHWNPTNRQHGSENPQGPHLGDLRNVTAAADSSVGVDVATPGGTLRGANAMLDGDGAAIIVHAGADTYRENLTGAPARRVACGVVQGR